MALPASLLQQIEQHPCFSGCYSSELEGWLCVDGARPLESVLFVSCLDCLSFKVGVLRSLLPSGSTSHTLANLLTQHMRRLRGFGLAFSGYHARGPGFWLSAAYYARCGLFLLDGARSRPLGSDLDLLMMAFKHGVAQPLDPQIIRHTQSLMNLRRVGKIVWIDLSAAEVGYIRLRPFLKCPNSGKPEFGMARRALDFAHADRSRGAPLPTLPSPMFSKQ